MFQKYSSMPYAVLAYSSDKFHRLGKSFVGYISDLCVDIDAR